MSKDSKKAKQTQAEAALGGTAAPAPGTNVQPQDAPDLAAEPAPPGYEEDNRSGGGYMGPTEPKYLQVSLASRNEIQAGLRRPWVQVTRINPGKALVRVAVYGELKGHDEPVFLGVATARYAIGQDGRVSGPFLFQDDSWSQYQTGQNVALSKLSRTASADQDKGAYFNELMQRANVSPFQNERGNGSYSMFSGALADDINAFLNKHASWIAKKILSLAPPARRAPATTAPPAPQAQGS